MWSQQSVESLREESQSRCRTHRIANKVVTGLVDDYSDNGAIQNDGDEEHQHHNNLHTGW